MNVGQLQRAFHRSFSRPYLWLWALWITGMASFGFGVVYTSSSRDYLIEIIIYVAFLAIPPPIVIITYAYVVESREGFGPNSSIINDITHLPPSRNADTAAALQAFSKEWSKWCESNIKEGKANDLSPIRAGEESYCPICLDEIDPHEEVKQLPCGHVLPLPCFDICFNKHVPLHSYGKNQHQCPLCREAFGPVYRPNRGSSMLSSRTSNTLPHETIWLA
ncbi:hypothetical protein FOL47_001487 [Perkinsus chesapeaki]|uniref:RING-type domain-containing protein n=1 Tax=Perkinsus chesapeaki TaxID=330153 RepID=A0A7J6MJ44_PERCH|nr:hypothetical protein FOL47_001487 [Perkinsus chesapeaki]